MPRAANTRTKPKRVAAPKRKPPAPKHKPASKPNSKPAGARELAMLPHVVALVWLEGEQEAFATPQDTPAFDPKYLEPGNFLDELREDGSAPREPIEAWTRAQWETLDNYLTDSLRLFFGPADLSLAVLATHMANYADSSFYHLREAVARHGLAVYPHVLAHAQRHPEATLSAIGPFDAPALVAPMLALAHKTKTRAAVETWLLRHPRATAIALVPIALGPTSKARKAARAALVQLKQHHGATLDAVASEYGADVGAQLHAVMR